MKNDLKPKTLTRDPDVLAAAGLVALLLLIPDANFARVGANPELFGILFGAVFGGRFGLRMVSTHGTAKTVAANGVGERLSVAPGIDLTDADLDEMESGA